MSDTTALWNDDDSPSPVDEAFAEFLVRFDRDRSIDLDRFFSSHEAAPQLRQAIEDFYAEQIRHTSPDKFWPGMHFGSLRIESCLGMGGLGVVYKARLIQRTAEGRLSRDCPVAVKFPLRTWSDNQRALFVRESKNAAALDHPNIVRILDADERYGHRFIAMQFVDGRTISQIIEDEGPPSIERAVAYFRKLAEAIQYAHSHNIYHRDLKPNNVMVDGFDMPRVIDFSLAKQIGTDRDLTGTRQGFGAERYAPPEYRDRGIDQDPARSDVYGLGTILYELLTGKKLFYQYDEETLSSRPASERPERPSSVRKAVPRDLSVICENCLEPLSSLRYASVSKLLEDLNFYELGRPLKHRPSTRSHRAALWIRRQRWAIAACMATIIVAAAALMIRHTLNANAGEAQHIAYVADMQTVESALDETNLDLAEKLLRRWTPSDDGYDRRGWEWHYLRGRTEQSTGVFRCEAGDIKDVACQPGGTNVAIATDGGMQLRDLAEPTLNRAFPGHDSVAWRPTGDLVATGGTDWLTFILSPSSASAPQPLAGHKGLVQVAAWSPDGRQLATGAFDGSVVVRTAELFTADHSIAASKHPIHAIAFAPAGDQLATASEKSVKLWSLRDGKHVRDLIEQPNVVESMSWHPTKSRLALTGHTANILILDPATGERVAELRRHKKRPRAVAWNPDGSLLASGGADQKITIWDGDSFEPIQILLGHRGSVRALSWTTDGSTLVSGGSDGSVRHWNLKTLRGRHTVIGRLPFAWTSDRMRLATSGADTTVRIYEATHNTPVAELFHPVGVFAIGWERNGQRLATAAGDGMIRIWDVKLGDVMKSLPSPRGSIHTLNWSPESQRLAIGSDEQTILIASTDDTESPMRLTGHTAAVMAVLWSPDGTLLASAGGDGQIGLWRVGKDAQLRLIDAHRGAITALAWSEDGKTLVSAGLDNRIAVWNAIDRTLVRSIVTETGTIRSVGICPDGRRIASGGDDAKVTLWDSSSGKKVFALASGPGSVHGLAWTSDGSDLFAYSSQTDSGSIDSESHVHRWRGTQGTATSTAVATAKHVSHAAFTDEFSGKELDATHWKVGRESVKLIDQSIALTNRGYLVTTHEYPTGIDIALDWKWIDRTGPRGYEDTLEVVLRSSGLPRAARAYDVVDGLIIKFSAINGTVLVYTRPDEVQLHATPTKTIHVPPNLWHRIRIVDQNDRLHVSFAHKQVLSIPLSLKTDRAHVAIYNREMVAGTHESRVDNVTISPALTVNP